jgi:hypothetical protein
MAVKESYGVEAALSAVATVDEAEPLDAVAVEVFVAGVAIAARLA